MGGYGGALKQLSIGVASSYGKAYIHGAGVPEYIWTSDHDSFLESMAEAEDPCLNDIGILVSTDPIAVDQACIDLVMPVMIPAKHISWSGLKAVMGSIQLRLLRHWDMARGSMS